MITTVKTSCRILASLLVKAGVRDVVVSSGSRNAPLIIAVEAESSLRKTVVTDERSAAFVALGISQATQRPVAMICTSGSAPLNYGPALSEAFYRGLPLIAISADRPREWIDQDDSQTIHQFKALDNVVKRSYDIPEGSGDDIDYRWFVNRTINDALIECRRGKPGPVHINIQLNAPLNGTADYIPSEERVISFVEAEQKVSPTLLSELHHEARGKRILLVAGFMQPDHKMQEAVRRLSLVPNVAIMAETISNLHLESENYSVDRVLSTMTDIEKESARPEIVITIGGALISRQVKEFLRKFTPGEHWSVGRQHTTVDSLRCLTRRIDVDPQNLLKSLANMLVRDTVRPEYRDLWHGFRSHADESASRFISKAPWSELKAFDTIFNHLPKHINLHLSNGTPIRYNQILARQSYHASFCNRGVSGIDGCTSTALGSAIATPNKNLLITGDMSFAYDISALASQLPDNFKIIVINNRGGGIFRFIATTRDFSCREKYFCAAPDVNISSAAQAFGLEYFSAECDSELKRALPRMIKSPRASILEIKVPAETGGDLLTKFMNRQNKI